jgi:hypothetical protein
VAVPEAGFVEHIRGYALHRYPQNYMFGCVHAALIVDGVTDGGADPATGGLVIGVSS